MSPTDDPHAEAATRLATLREELKLKAHLAGMDARTWWEEELLPGLESLEARLRQSAGEARVQLHLGVMELRDAWSALEPRVLDAIDRIGAEGRLAQERLREAKQALEQAAAEAEERS